MKKDAFYFPHFSNARQDRKIKRLRKELGIEGYGIFFMLLEVLREQPEYKYPLQDIDLLADDFDTSEPKLRTVITNYQLFDIDENEDIFSIRFNEYMQPYLKMKEQRRIAGLASAEKRRQKSLTAVEQPLNDHSTKESKVKESKVKKSKVFKPPTLEQVKEYCKERNNDVNPEKWMNFYTSKGWMIGKNKMKDWQAAVRTWEGKNRSAKKETPEWILNDWKKQQENG